MHLWDEVDSWDGKDDSHYLVCDACEMILRLGDRNGDTTHMDSTYVKVMSNE